MQKRGVSHQISKHVMVHYFLSLAFELLMILRLMFQKPEQKSSEQCILMFQYQQVHSPYCCLYVSYGKRWENLNQHQDLFGDHFLHSHDLNRLIN